MIRVALLIPVYNNQNGISYSLRSLPTDVDLDIVVVDDGSNPPIVLKESYGQHRVILIRKEENQGIVHALNDGLRWIFSREYEYVARLDAGDTMLPNRIRGQLEFLDLNPDCGMVGGQSRFVDESGVELFRDRFPTENCKIRRAMHGRSCFSHPAVMLRVNVLRKVGVYDVRYETAQDFELFFRIINYCTVANLEEDVICCLVDPNGISLTKRRAQVINRIKVMLRYFDPRLPESYLGLVKSIILLITPAAFVRVIKRTIGARRRGWL